jgi:hypothetical protein
MEKSAGKWKKVIGNYGKKCLKWHKMLINGKKSRVNEKVSINKWKKKCTECQIPNIWSICEQVLFKKGYLDAKFF